MASRLGIALAQTSPAFEAPPAVPSLAAPRLGVSLGHWRAKLGTLGKYTVIVGMLAPLSAVSEREVMAERGQVSTPEDPLGRPSLPGEHGASSKAAHRPPLSPASGDVLPRSQTPTRRGEVTARVRDRHRVTLNPRPVEPVPVATKNQLMAEVEQLDAARAALRASFARKALALLDDYDARFPLGKLALEAAVLRVRGLMDSGQSTDAVRLARQTSSRPGSERYRAELERLIAPQKR